MPDRSLRLHPLPPQPVPGERGALLRERPSSPPESDEPRGDEDNPFAPPAEGTPDRPWHPRHPASGGDTPAPWGPPNGGGQGPDDGQGNGTGPGNGGPWNGGGPGDGGGGTPPGGHSPWGGHWSDQQPGRAPGGGFGERPGGGPEGPNPTPNPRWDPTDPAQRRARYALLCGMWAFFFALFGWPYVALLLGALALNWGISALRTKPPTPSPDTPAAPTSRPQTTAAISGLVTASLALALVAVTFTAQLVYRDYYTCTKDALTNEARQSCNDLLPKELKNILGANT
ncbi:hypothetical protein [Streptomyces sp. NBC_00582]|uniref:hypothetical protein n=1 Tax=Streptomyces sp. NBC_00582 TaxID=2975783 RepID=UPI002E80C74C|nr:hypothetical protein [Streptomyces sp. NBC_00582]WUB62394.1 hypothetical protein OG852_19320 [Streptomyces sp. NBC_00582]